MNWPVNANKVFVRCDLISTKHLTDTTKAKFGKLYSSFAIDEEDASRKPSTSQQATPERKRSSSKTIFIKVNSYDESCEEVEEKNEKLLEVPKVEASSSSETLAGMSTSKKSVLLNSQTLNRCRSRPMWKLRSRVTSG